MALRGDFPGGGIGGPGGTPGYFNHVPDKNIAIEQYCKWNWAFFIGALLVTTVALGTGFHWIRYPTFAPGTFFFEIFLLAFGLLMIVLDLPLPHLQSHRYMQQVRQHVYKFALFMTRFVGRGVWYLFLATLVFSALWDTGINIWLGAVTTAYLTGLGVAAIGKGLTMSNKLNHVKECISSAGYAAERYMTNQQSALSVDQFRLMVESATSEHDLFTPEELAYIMSALSFQPYSQGEVTLDELKYWLMPGPPLMV